MPYQALYRKWRPETFDEVVGQDAVMTTLKNQVNAGRVGHAYLFCGTRGTGKTSAAKILSRAVNCPNARENGGNPCNSCDICTSIISGRAMSVFEIDAASNNGVDNIREIREEVEYPPTTGRYKVYIIDEVHMLSMGAFNALLKTLEEPPAYVIFILATTDPERIPATILSRCQRYDFRRIPLETIEKHLNGIIQNEGRKTEPKAVSYIAEACDGSMRDALSILDQCLSLHSTEEGLRYTDVLNILGALDTEVYSRLYRCILKGDTEGALGLVGSVLNSGTDVTQLINDFIRHLRNVLLSGNIKGDSSGVLDLSAETVSLSRADYALAGKDTLIYMLKSLAELSNRVRYSPQKRVLLEVELIRLSSEKGSEEVAKAEAVRPVSAKRDPKESIEPEVQTKQGMPAVKNTVSERKQSSAEPQNLTASGPETELINSESKSGDRPGPKINTEAETADDIKGKADDKIIDILEANWPQLVRKLHATNRSLFGQVLLREEAGAIVMLFKNNMNYKMAAGNKIENGVLRLRQLAKELTGEDVKLMARTARPGEFTENKDRITDEELAAINFPVETED